MLADENSLYFITAKGKAFYSQLMENPYVAISGMCGGDGTMHKKAISIQGKAVNIGSEKLGEVFRQNPYMGTGEFFDLSVKPIYRDTFVLGAGQERAEQTGGYFITDRCHGCRICYSKCPQKCIDMTAKPFVIQQEHCLHCGNCIAACPFDAVEKRV